MILPNAELLSSLQSSIADGGQKSLGLDLMDAELQSNSNQNFNTTLDETLAHERSTGHKKASEMPSNSTDAAVSECSRMQSSSDQEPAGNQFKGLTESSEIGAQSHLSDTPIERVGNIGGDDRPQVNDALGDNSLRNAQRADSEVPAHAQSEPPKHQMVSGEKGLPASVVEHSQRSGQLELSSAKSEQNLTTVSDSHTSRSERFSQAASRPVESVSVTGQRSLVDAAMPYQQDESILLEKKLVTGERENRPVLHNEKPVDQNFSTHNTNLKTVPEARSERLSNSKLSAVVADALPAISDSRQSYPSLSSHAGQVAKFDASILEERVMQEAKQSLEESFDEVKGKSTRHEARFEKSAQSGGFLENSQPVGGSSAKSTTATPNNTSTVLMQRMVDTIQELKQSQNVQRVSFELDLAHGEKLKVRLRLSGDQVKSVFTTDSNTLKLLIRENWDQLQRQVETEGLDLAQPDFADRSPQQSFYAEEELASNEAFQADLNKSSASAHSGEKDDTDTGAADHVNDNADSAVIRYA